MQGDSEGGTGEIPLQALKDMDAPSAFFFNLEKKEATKKLMALLRLLDGRMRQHAVKFYSSLFRAEECDQCCTAELLQGLPRLSQGKRVDMDREQKQLVDFFWTGQHWIGGGALYLPVEEVRLGLVDIRSKVMSLRLQTVQRPVWSAVAGDCREASEEGKPIGILQTAVPGLAG